MTMKKTAPKKIRLSRETLGNLTDTQMKAVEGGQKPYLPTTDSEDACCA
jgi:hypothetical protein